jgi:hypothetical protein
MKELIRKPKEGLYGKGVTRCPRCHRRPRTACTPALSALPIFPSHPKGVTKVSPKVPKPAPSQRRQGLAPYLEFAHWHAPCVTIPNPERLTTGDPRE